MCIEGWPGARRADGTQTVRRAAPAGGFGRGGGGARSGTGRGGHGPAGPGLCPSLPWVHARAGEGPSLALRGGKSAHARVCAEAAASSPAPGWWCPGSPVGVGAEHGTSRDPKRAFLLPPASRQSGLHKTSVTCQNRACFLVLLWSRFEMFIRAPVLPFPASSSAPLALLCAPNYSLPLLPSLCFLSASLPVLGALREAPRRGWLRALLMTSNITTGHLFFWGWLSLQCIISHLPVSLHNRRTPRRLPAPPSPCWPGGRLRAPGLPTSSDGLARRIAAGDGRAERRIPASRERRQ